MVHRLAVSTLDITESNAECTTRKKFNGQQQYLVLYEALKIKVPQCQLEHIPSTQELYTMEYAFCISSMSINERDDPYLH